MSHWPSRPHSDLAPHGRVKEAEQAGVGASLRLTIWFCRQSDVLGGLRSPQLCGQGVGPLSSLRWTPAQLQSWAHRIFSVPTTTFFGSRADFTDKETESARLGLVQSVPADQPKGHQTSGRQPGTQACLWLPSSRQTCSCFQGEDPPPAPRETMFLVCV